MLLRLSYAMSGTDLGYAHQATPPCSRTPSLTSSPRGTVAPLLSSYAMSGTHLAYAATRCPVLSLCDGWY
eukprot:3511000-Rhodomonas_salina.1